VCLWACARTLFCVVGAVLVVCCITSYFWRSSWKYHWFLWGGVVLVSLMSEQKCIVLNWNVRGVNNRARRQVVKDMASDTACTIAALQET